jgi:Superinfection immunity protein/Resolvase, N terminal domain
VIFSTFVHAIAEMGAGFRSLKDTWADTTTPHGRLMLTMLGGLAEFERELIRARTGRAVTMGDPETVRAVFILILLFVALLVYLFPTLIAFIRRHPSRWGIAVVNVAFGWVFMGWILALVWAVSAKTTTVEIEGTTDVRIVE